MDKLTEKMEQILVPVATKVGNNKILKAISTGFNMIMPLIIIGSIFSMVATIDLGSYQSLLESTGLKTILSLVGTFTTEFLSVYVAFAITYAYVSEQNKTGAAISAGFMAIMAFLIMTPLTTAIVNETEITALTFDYLGSKGLFTAMLVGLLVGYIYMFVLDRGWTIKMPSGVPPTVSQSFSALIPGFIIGAVFLVIHGLFAYFTGETFSEWFYALIATPLSALSGSLATYMLLTFVGTLLWFFGIHGGQVTGPFYMILYMQAGIENQAAYAAGQPMLNIITFAWLYLLIGGAGCTTGLNIDMLLFGKSERYKALGKLSIIPQLTGINEPLIFGMPMILNPIMAIPFFLAPQVLIVITYVMMYFGLASYPIMATGAAGTPIFLGGYLICGISGIWLTLIQVIVSMVLYYPFFKIQDNMALKDEMENA